MYMGYFAGNIKNVRVPVARQLRSKFNLSAAEPKGQIITTIGVAISVYVNLIILAIVVVLGSALVSVLPDVVLESFSYVIPALIGALLAFRVDESGIVTTLKWCDSGSHYLWSYENWKVPFLADFGCLTSIGIRF